MTQKSDQKRKIIYTSQAPQAIGAYSQGVCWGNMVFSAGQIPLVPETGQLATGSFEDQVQQVLRNISGILSAAGSSLDDVLKFTVYLTSLDDYAALNTVFNRYFTADPPARSVVQVAALPLGATVEIEAIAVKY